MKIALAQISSKKGDLKANSFHHHKLIELAINQGATIIIFPELSITGYEPHLAKALASQFNDPIFSDFQKISDEKNIRIGFGAPTKNKQGVFISMLLFSPNQARQLYSKKYLHEDEKPFFSSGDNETIFIKNTKIALAICYELSVKAHAASAMENSAAFYLASVAKTADGVEKAHKRLAYIAKENKIPVLMVNSVGPNDDFISAGQSAVWDAKGTLVGAMNTTEEGLLIFDADSNKVVKSNFHNGF